MLKWYTLNSRSGCCCHGCCQWNINKFPFTRSSVTYRALTSHLMSGRKNKTTSRDGEERKKLVLLCCAAGDVTSRQAHAPPSNCTLRNWKRVLHNYVHQSADISGRVQPTYFSIVRHPVHTPSRMRLHNLQYKLVIAGALLFMRVTCSKSHERRRSRERVGYVRSSFSKDLLLTEANRLATSPFAVLHQHLSLSFIFQLPYLLTVGVRLIGLSTSPSPCEKRYWNPSCPRVSRPVKVERVAQFNLGASER